MDSADHPSIKAAVEEERDGACHPTTAMLAADHASDDDTGDDTPTSILVAMQQLKMA